MPFPSDPPRLSNRRAVLAATVKGEWERYRRSSKEAVTAYLAAGAALCEAREGAERGEWGAFLRAAGIEARTARNMMRLARAGVDAEFVSASGGVAAVLESLRAGARFGAGAPHSPDYYTPADLLAVARRAMGGGFDLDPASTPRANEVVQAARIYTEAEDGLAMPWRADRLWLNPPYAAGVVGRWVGKLLAAVRAGDVREACLLLNAVVDTAYGQDAMAAAGAVFFPRGRVKFWGPGAKGTGAQTGQMICYFGPAPYEFAREFGAAGIVWTRRR